MQDDFLDAQAARQWAETQIPLLQRDFIDWKDANPFRIAREGHPDGTCDVIVAVDEQPLPLTCNAWVGAIINSLRSSLDLVAAALAKRKGKNVEKSVYFPICCSRPAFETRLKSIKWLSGNEKDAVKSFRPYRGGDDLLWPLHYLDIVRKHRRLIVTLPRVVAFVHRSPEGTRMGTAASVERLENKTVLFRLVPGDTFDITEDNPQIATRLVFDDTEAGMTNWEVPLALRGFSERVLRVIEAVGAL